MSDSMTSPGGPGRSEPSVLSSSPGDIGYALNDQGCANHMAAHRP
jgi:hypothetical protein